MMNRAEMLRPSDILARLPTVTDQEVQINLRSKIDPIREDVESHIRIPDALGLTIHTRLLFSFTGEEFSSLRDASDGIIGKVESDRLQGLGLEMMRQYGLDEKISRPTRHKSKWIKDGVIHDVNGNSREMRAYPSQTINGLTFQQTRRYIIATGETLSISWEVQDEAPQCRIKFGNKVKK